MVWTCASSSFVEGSKYHKYDVVLWVGENIGLHTRHFLDNSKTRLMASVTQTNSTYSVSTGGEVSVHTINSLDRPDSLYPDTSSFDDVEHAIHYGWHFFLGEKCTPTPRRRTARYYIEENGSTSVKVSMEYSGHNDNETMSRAEYHWIIGDLEMPNFRSINPDENPNIQEQKYNTRVDASAQATTTTTPSNVVKENQNIEHCNIVEEGQTPQLGRQSKEVGVVQQVGEEIKGAGKRKAEAEEVAYVPSKKARKMSSKRMEGGIEAQVASGSNVTLDGAQVELSNYSCKVEGCNYVATSTKEGSAKLCFSRHMLGHESDPLVYVCLGPTGCKKCYIRADSCKRHIDGEVRNGVRVSTCSGTRVAMQASEYRCRFPDFRDRLAICLKGKSRR